VQGWLYGRGDNARRSHSSTAGTTPHLVGLCDVPGPGPAGRCGRGGGVGRGGLSRPRCWRGFLGRVSTLQPVAFCPPPDAVGLRLFDARGVAGHAYPHRQGEVKAFFICEAELACQLVHPDLFGQVPRQYLSSSIRSSSIRSSSSWSPPVVAAPSLGPILACSEAVANISSISPARISARKARLKAPRRPALLMQSGLANSVPPSLQSQAPLPWPFRSTTSWPAGPRTIRTSVPVAL
jgi:hypothetical protein